MTADDLAWTHDERLLASNNDGLPPLASPKFPENGTQTLSLLLLDGSARTLLYRPTIIERILPHLGQVADAFYVALVYGDYPPSSAHVVETIYTGGSVETLMETVGRWPFHGGTPIRNALHEGLAACLDTMSQVDLENVSLTVISNSFSYEEFHKNAPILVSAGFLGKTMAELLMALQRRRVKVSFFWPAAELATSTLRGIQQVLGVEGSADLGGIQLPEGWYARAFSFDAGGRPKSTTKSIGGSSDEFHRAELPLANSALETTVRQFLAAVLKLPQNQRAETIKRHLESPAYSVEYKQCLVAMVRQMQSTARKASSPPSAAAGSHRSTAPTAGMPTPTPSQGGSLGTPAAMATVAGRVNPGTPMWRGRLAYRSHAEQFQFDISAIPIANPKCSNPHQTPTVAEFQTQAWPLILAISSFISVQSPAVAKSVPIAKLVDLQPLAPDGTPVSANEASLALRNLLVSRQIVGLVRLGTTHAMLVAARPYQLVGMVISKQAASALAQSTHPGASQSRPAVAHQQPHPSADLASSHMMDSAMYSSLACSPPYPVAAPPPPMPHRGPPPSTAHSVHHAELLTPDAILRQRQSARTSAPASTAPTPAATDHHSVHSGGSGNLDVFNALMTDFGAEMGGGPADDGLSPFDYLDFSPHVFPHGTDQHPSYL